MLLSRTYRNKVFFLTNKRTTLLETCKCIFLYNEQIKSIYLSSINHEPSILTMRRDGQKRKIIRKMCIYQQNNHSVQDKNSLVLH